MSVHPTINGLLQFGSGACTLALCLFMLGACDQRESAINAETTPPGIQVRRSGIVQSNQLDEISGLQASRRHPGVLWAHNDDGRPRVHALGNDGRDLGHFDIDEAVNVDWEDMTLIPGQDRDLLVLADIGDNSAKRARVWLYLVEEPEPGPDGRFSGSKPAAHWISLDYPDGPRDAESIAWDPLGQQLLLLSKRQRPFRLYALDARVALEQTEATLEFLGEVDSLRPPTPSDRARFGDRAPWVSQPTGLDISADGATAAVLSYRSLYLFDRKDDSGWLSVLNDTPIEIIGPPGDSEEAVSFGSEAGQIWVSGEGLGAGLFEFRRAPAPAAGTPP